jgi:flagellar biosynthesis protein FlhB
MAEESNYSRTEPASERRLARARAEGQVPRSAELSSLLVLAAMAGGLALWGARLFSRLQDLMAAHFRSVAQLAPDSAFSLLQQVTLEVFPFLAALFVAGLLAPMLLSGWVFAPRVIQFQGGRLNPLSRLLRLFSANGLFDGLKAVAMWLTAGAMLAWFFRAHLQELAMLLAVPLEDAAASAGGLLLKGLLLLLGVAFLAALLDAPWQWWRYLRGLAMTRAEVLAEARESEGSPEFKARIRARQRRAQKESAE